MNFFRTAILLAGLTALFLFVGFMIGGETGMVIAFLVALGMNFFAYWKSDKVVLSMYRAREVDRNSAPGFYGIVEQLAANANLPMPKVYVIDNPQPNADPEEEEEQQLLASSNTESYAGVDYNTAIEKTIRLDPPPQASAM